MGQGAPGQERAPSPAAGTTISPREKDGLEESAPHRDFPTCPTCAPASSPTPEAEVPGRDTSPAGAALGCPQRSKLNLPSDIHPKRLAQALPRTSPRAFPASRSPDRAAVRPAPLPVRSAPGYSHSRRGARGRGTAAAAGGEPRSGRVRQGGRCSPRGGAAPSGRAPARGGGSCNSGWGGRVCPELWGEGGAGRGRSGAGTGEQGRPWRDPGAGCWERTGGRRDQGRRTSEVLPSPLPIHCPRPSPGLGLPATYAACGFSCKKLLEAPWGSSSRPISPFCSPSGSGGSDCGLGAWVIQPRPPA